MTKLPFVFSVHAYEFHRQLDRLESAFDASVAALGVDVERAKFALSEIPSDPKVVWGHWGGPKPLDDVDDLDVERYKEMVLDDALDSLRHLQHAFILVLYHVWERHSTRWAGIRQYDLNKVVLLLISLGATPDVERLKELRLLANTIKHNDRKLYEHSPMLFEPVGNNLTGSSPDYASALIVSDDQIRELISVLRGSGPVS